ncbi:hypothetical protein AgCh_003910 [Apium graveolens]
MYPLEIWRVSLNCKKPRSLPDSICSLRTLEVLTISCCTGLKALPSELGSIESLVSLFASELSVSKLPDSIGCLSNLVELDLSCNKNLETLSDSICKLRSLEILDIIGCRKIEELPDQLGFITCLRELKLEDTMLRMIPDISQLSNIKDLDLYGFHHLVSIPELPTNLEWIEATDCTSLKILPDLSGLKHLKKMDLSNCVALQEIPGSEEVTSLEDLCHYSCREGDKIELKSDQKMICEIYLLYKTKTENATASEYFSTTDNVEDERSNPLCSDLESKKKWLSLSSSSTTVNVEERRNNPSDTDLESNKKWLSLGSSSTTVKSG